MNPWEPDYEIRLVGFSPRLYHWLRLHSVKHRWAMWIAHPIDRLREWLYWRNVLLLPWEGHGWEINSKRNRDRRKAQEIGHKRFSGMDA